MRSSVSQGNGRSDLRLVVVSPFLDRQHGTEGCIVEQIERLAFQDGWEVHLYAQHVDQVHGVCLSASLPGSANKSIVWHKVSKIPGPYLLKYLWWLCANQLLRSRDRLFGRTKADLIYSPGINCFDVDVVVVHIVFHEFFSRVSSELQLRRVPSRQWYLVIHRRLYYKFAMFLENRVYRSRRVRLIAVSGLVAQQLKVHFGRSDVSVIANAIDTNRFTTEERYARRAESRKLLGFSDHEVVLLLIGNDWKKKGLDYLLKALVFLSELFVRVLVVGSDDPRLYETQLANISSPERVRFLYPSSDVISFYAAADVYVGPSLEDAFGLPILEAMACGLPVIASVHAGASEFIRDGETGFLLADPCDPLEIARLVRRLYEDASLRGRIGHAASIFVRANCNWKENVSKTREFLERVLQERQHRG
jgi:glycosyltransferase involved in cell wall biosynthesis